MKISGGEIIRECGRDGQAWCKILDNEMIFLLAYLNQMEYIIIKTTCYVRY